MKSYIGTHKDKESGGTIIGIKVPLNNRNYINYIEPALKKLDYQYVIKNQIIVDTIVFYYLKMKKKLNIY